MVSASDSRKLLRRFAARGSASDAGASPRNSSRLPRKSRRNDASSRSGEAHRGASGATPGSGGASSHAQMPDRSRSVSSMSRPRSGNGEAGSRLGASSSSRLPRMNARSVGSASHADAVDADMPSATGSGERDVWSSSSSSRVRGRSRTPVRRGSGAPETFGSQTAFFCHVAKKRTRVRANHRPFRSAAFARRKFAEMPRGTKKSNDHDGERARRVRGARGLPDAWRSRRVLTGRREGAPRGRAESRPPRRGAVSRARSADFSNARRCRLAARDDRQRLLRCVERRRGAAARPRRASSRMSRTAGRFRCDVAAERDRSTLGPRPAGRVPSVSAIFGTRLLSGHRVRLVLYIFAIAGSGVELEPERARLPSLSRSIRRRPSTRARQRYHPRLGRRRRGEFRELHDALRASRRGAALCPRGGRGGGEAAAGC